jgi:RsmE family RNA methyltransferase
VNLILLAAADYIAPGHVRLSDSRCRHIRDILRGEAGARIRVGAIGGLIGSGEILRSEPNAVELRVTLEQAPPPKLPLTVILALPRPKMLRRALRTVAELGVRELILLNTAKVEKSYWQSPALAPDTVRNYLLDGLQQARDTVIPAVHCERLFKPFAEDRLPALAAGTAGLVAHPDSGAACPFALDRPCTLAIGPEGGFTPYEIDKLSAAGLQSVHLGARILRVENALVALVARLFS